MLLFGSACWVGGEGVCVPLGFEELRIIFGPGSFLLLF